MNILVTGATGYIGGRLIPALLNNGYTVRALARDPARIQGRSWSDRIEIAIGDLMDPASLSDALKDIDVAFYLVHSMYAGSDFAQKDRKAVLNFIEAAKDVKHVIYLGGHLPRPDVVPSNHLKSRAEVGTLLRENLPTTEFRAGVIIGSGSASFEIVRYLTERLPVMITPKWVRNYAQPISIRDILKYLLRAVEMPPMDIVEVGSEKLTFLEMMRGYAEVRGMKRVIIPVPVLTPRLAALWIGFVTPVPNSLAVPVVEGLIHDVIGDTRKAAQLFPDIEPIPYKKAVEDAISRVAENNVETRWTNSMGGEAAYQLTTREGLIEEVRTFNIDSPPEKAFRFVCALGGDKGWLVYHWAWLIRGEIDHLIGGPGLRRGRRDPENLVVGDAVDFWRVESVVPNRLLRLRAEMKVPGRAWLQFETLPDGSGTKLVQKAIFEPRGIGGLVYWYGLYPFHKAIFSKMIKEIASGIENNGL